MVNLKELNEVSDAPITRIGIHRQDWQLLSLLEYIEDTYNLLKKQPRLLGNVKSFQLMQSFKQAAFEYYSAVHHVLEKARASESDALNDDYERACALRKINAEWLELASLVQSSELADNKHVQLLQRIVMGISDTLPQPPKIKEKAPFSLSPVSATRPQPYMDEASTLQRGDTILPLFGSKFEMRHFIFAPHIKVLAMPTYALYAPWRWSVIWHEIAGIIMKQDHAQALIGALVEDIGEGWWQHWELKGSYYGEERDTEEDEDFVVKLVYNIPNRRGWVEEMLEDAFSVLALGEPALKIMHEILAEYHSDLTRQNDERHPAPAVRLELAYQLLILMGETPTDAAIEKIRATYDSLSEVFTDPMIKRIAKWIYDHRAQLINLEALAGAGNQSETPGPALQARDAFLKAFQSFATQNFKAASVDGQTIDTLFDSVHHQASKVFGTSQDRVERDGWELDADALAKQLEIWLKAVAEARAKPTLRDQLKALKALHFVEIDAMLENKVETHTHRDGDLAKEGSLQLTVKGDKFHECDHEGKTLTIYRHTHNFNAQTGKWSGFNFKG